MHPHRVAAPVLPGTTASLQVFASFAKRDKATFASFRVDTYATAKTAPGSPGCNTTCATNAPFAALRWRICSSSFSLEGCRFHVEASQGEGGLGCVVVRGGSPPHAKQSVNGAARGLNFFLFMSGD